MPAGRLVYVEPGMMIEMCAKRDCNVKGYNGGL